jgi:hypothetical protein
MLGNGPTKIALRLQGQKGLKMFKLELFIVVLAACMPLL